MSEAIEAYRNIASSSKFRENERMYVKIMHDEAQILRNVKRRREQRAKLNKN